LCSCQKKMAFVFSFGVLVNAWLNRKAKGREFESWQETGQEALLLQRDCATRFVSRNLVKW